jgi:hypothetical protein
VLVVAVLVFGVGQLVLPGIAASVLRGRLAKSGRVQSVRVWAFPAIELLWQQADRVVIRMADYTSGAGHLASLLQQASGVGSLSASVGVLRSGLLTLHDARLTKSGGQLNGSGTLLESDLRTAVPVLQSVRLLSASADSLTLEGTADVLGFTATVPATVEPQAGHLVVVPQTPLGGVVAITVFAQPHVDVEGVGGSAIAGGLKVTARGRVT